MFPAVRTFSWWRSWNGGAGGAPGTAAPLADGHVDAPRAAFRSVHIQRPFRIDAIVILPDHSAPENLVLDQLRAIRGEIAELKEGQAHMERRLSTVEHHFSIAGGGASSASSAAWS